MKKIILVFIILFIVLLSGCAKKFDECDINKDGKVTDFEKQRCRQQDDTGKSRCGDGVCGPLEKANPSLCPQDCEEGATGNGPIENMQKISILVVIHAGEGPCEMSRATLTDIRYINCRDRLKTASDELSELRIPVTFEFLGPFAELLSKDSAFSFDNDILTKGHSIGFHAHSHCYYDGTTGSNECTGINLENEMYWGKIGLDAKPTFTQLLERIDSARMFTPRKEIGGLHGMAHQYKQNPDKLISELNKRGIKIWTGTFTVEKDYYPVGSSCNKQTNNLKLNPHPITAVSNYPDVVYFDHGPAFANQDLIGHPDFNVETSKQRFQALVKCRDAEQSTTNPYIFAMGTHFWNIITNEDENPDEFDGISDIKTFKQWVNENYANTTIFSNIKEVYIEFIEKQN